MCDGQRYIVLVVEPKGLQSRSHILSKAHHVGGLIPARGWRERSGNMGNIEY